MTFSEKDFDGVGSPTTQLMTAREAAKSGPPPLTVADVHEALAQSAKGADELNEQLRDAALNVNLDLRLR